MSIASTSAPSAAAPNASATDAKPAPGGADRSTPPRTRDVIRHEKSDVRYDTRELAGELASFHFGPAHGTAADLDETLRKLPARTVSFQGTREGLARFVERHTHARRKHQGG